MLGLFNFESLHFEKVDSKVLNMTIYVKSFDENKMVQILGLFLRNKFWYTGIQSPRFCKWPWILNRSDWILLVDISVQILLTIMESINHSSRCFKIGRLRNSTHQGEGLHNKRYRSQNLQGNESQKSEQNLIENA